MSTGQLDKDSRNGLWVSGSRQWGNQKENSGFPGYDYGVNAGMIGFDYTFPTKIMLGLSAILQLQMLTWMAMWVEGDINSFNFALYGSYFTTNAYIETSIVLWQKQL